MKTSETHIINSIIEAIEFFAQAKGCPAGAEMMVDMLNKFGHSKLADLDKFALKALPEADRRTMYDLLLHVSLAFGGVPYYMPAVHKRVKKANGSDLTQDWDSDTGDYVDSGDVETELEAS